MCSTLLFLWHEAHERLQSQFYHLSHLGIEVGDVVDFVSQDLILCVDAKEKCTKFMETLRCIICWTYNSGA